MLLLCLTPFIGFAQGQPGLVNQDQAGFGQPRYSEELPSQLHFTGIPGGGRSASAEYWAHGMFVPKEGDNYGYYYGIDRNGTVTPIRRYNEWYFRSAEYYAGNPDMDPMWGFANDYTRGWMNIELGTGNPTKIATATMVMNDLTYDYSKDRMLGIKDGCIYEISMENGLVNTMLYDYRDFDNIKPITIAADINGDIYFINYSEDGVDSKLYKFAADDEYFEELIEVGSVEWPAQWIQTMSFDHRTGALYWWQTMDNGSYNDYANFVKVDKNTGATTLVGGPFSTGLAGLSFDFENRPYTAYSNDGELGTIRLKNGNAYSLTQKDYMPGDMVEFKVTNDEDYAVAYVKVFVHGTDEEILTIDGSEITNGLGAFMMVGNDIDIVGEWIGIENEITYEWTPDDVDGLEISGPDVANYMSDVTVNFTTDVIGYILTGLTAQSGSTNIQVTPLDPDETGMRQFVMPADEVTVTGIYQAIELDSLPDVCQYSAQEVPSYTAFDGVTDAEIQVLKPDTDEWFPFYDDDWANGENFDVAGTWQYRVELANEYGSFLSVTRAFEVYAAPQSIAIDGNSGVCIGSDMELSVAFTPADYTVGGTLQWYKDGEILANETQSTLTIESATVDDAGSYSVTYTTEDGNCELEAEALDVAVNPLPEIAWELPLSSDTIIIFKGEVALQALPEGGDYFWLDTINNEWVEIDGNTFSDEGQYQFIYSYTDENGCSNVSDTLTAIVAHLHNIDLNPGTGGQLATSNGETVAYTYDTVYITSEANECMHITGITVYKVSDHTMIIPSTFDAQSGMCSFVMPEYDVDVCATWGNNVNAVTYQWTPADLTSALTGSAVGTCGNYVTVTYKTNLPYILTGLTGDQGVTIEPMDPAQNGKRRFVMPDAHVTLTAAYSPIEVSEIPNVCQFNAPGAPVVSPTAGVTETIIQLKKPNGNWPTDNTGTSVDDLNNNGDLFDVAGTWQYRVKLVNSYGTFTSAALSFVVYAAPESIAIEGNTSVCENGTLELSVVPTPADASMDGQYQWYKDGTPLPDFTYAQLTIENVTVDDAGSYSVVYTIMDTTTNNNPNGVQLCQFETEAYEVTVNALPEVAWVYPSADTGDTIVLGLAQEVYQLEATPDGGEFFYLVADGTGSSTTIEDGLLYPAQLGEGVFELTYSYTDTTTQCSADTTIIVKFEKLYWTDPDIRDNEWYDRCVDEGRFEITNPYEMGAFAAMVSGYNRDNVIDFAEDTIYLMNDINLLEEPYFFRPLNNFLGLFEGNGHVIDSMVIDEEGLEMNFNGTYRNIGFKDAKITNVSDTVSEIEILGTMYNSYFTNPDLTNIEFNFNPTGDVQNVYYYNKRGEEVVSKYFGLANIVEVYNNDSVFDKLPANVYYGYSLTQQIYPVDQRVANAGSIVALQFHAMADAIGRDIKDLRERTWEIYMTTTEQPYYDSLANYTYIVPTDDSKVFDGTFTYGESDWFNVQLDNPFEYDGTGNLLLTIYDKTGSWISTTYSTVTLTENAQSVYFYQDSEGFDLEVPSAEYQGLLNCISDMRFVAKVSLDVTPEELLTGEGQNEAEGYLADWVWLQNKYDYFSWMQDPIGDETGNYGYAVMDAPFEHHHYVDLFAFEYDGEEIGRTRSGDAGHYEFNTFTCELGGAIKDRVIGSDEYMYAMGGDTITLAVTANAFCVVDTVMFAALYHRTEDEYEPIPYTVEDDVYTLVMPLDSLYDEAYRLEIEIVSSKDYWTDEGNYDPDWFANGVNANGIYEITSNEQFAAFARALEEGYSFIDTLVWITDALGPNDNPAEKKLNMAAHLWKPQAFFEGILDGRGFIIDSLNIQEGYYNADGRDAYEHYYQNYMLGEIGYNNGANAAVRNLGIHDIIIPDSCCVFQQGYSSEGGIYNCFITKDIENDTTSYFIAPEGANVYNTYILTFETIDATALLDSLNTWVENNQTDDPIYLSWIADADDINYGYPIHNAGQGGKNDHDVTNAVLLGNQELEVSLYPNPTQGEVKVLCDDAKIDRVRVFNMLGQVVLDTEIHNNETILHFENSATGVYMVKIFTEQGYVIKKLMLE